MFSFVSAKIKSNLNLASLSYDVFLGNVVSNHIIHIIHIIDHRPSSFPSWFHFLSLVPIRSIMSYHIKSFKNVSYHLIQYLFHLISSYFISFHITFAHLISYYTKSHHMAWHNLPSYGIPIHIISSRITSRHDISLHLVSNHLVLHLYTTLTQCVRLTSRMATRCLLAESCFSLAKQQSNTAYSEEN